MFNFYMQNFVALTLCHLKFGCHIHEYLVYCLMLGGVCIHLFYLFSVGCLYYAAPIDSSVLSQSDAY